MDGRQIRVTRCLLLVVSASWSMGCSAIWREVPSPVSPESKVHLDASWVLENPSKEVVTRFTEERQNHIADVMSNRQKGVIGVSLDEAIHGHPAPSTPFAESSVDASTPASKAEKTHSATKINALPPLESSGSGRLMLKVKGGTNYVR